MLKLQAGKKNFHKQPTLIVILFEIVVHSYIFLNMSARYHSLAPMYYRGAQAAIVVYDITNTVRKYYCIKTYMKNDIYERAGGQTTSDEGNP